MMKKTFNLWAAGCCHVATDMRVSGYESLVTAIKDSERDFEWDIMLNLGDYAGNFPPGEDEGREVTRQFSVLKKHRREDIYSLAGNHDADAPGENMRWFRKWIDPAGENPEFSGVHAENRPFAISGTWERYSFRLGNILFLMMSDRNDEGPHRERDPRGGNPGGVVTKETFEWWKEMVEVNQDSIIISAHHYMLKDTTVASGEWEGFRKDNDGNWAQKYHGYVAGGAPRGASYLYFVGDDPDSRAFENYMEKNPGAVDIWLGAHTHTNPDDKTGNKSHIEKKWGIWFINVAALARHHGRYTTIPLSRLLTFQDGSSRIQIQCYLHTDDYAPKGWYPEVESNINLSKPFMLERSHQ